MGIDKDVSAYLEYLLPPEHYGPWWGNGSIEILGDPFESLIPPKTVRLRETLRDTSAIAMALTLTRA